MKIIQSLGNLLFIKFELIGYKNSGEGVIISIIDENETILWCGVVDCFSYRKINQTISKLESYGYGKNKKIDFLCISHPDKDHILEIDQIIKEYTDDNTMFSLPDFFNSNIKQTVEIKRIKEVLGDRFCFKTRSDVSKNNIFFNKKMAESQLRWKFISGVTEHVLQIESLTPCDTIIQASRRLNYSQFKNDFSISLKIKLDENIYYLMGDSTELALNNVDPYDFVGKASYLKIPHHGDANIAMENLVKESYIENLNVSTCAYRKNTTLIDTLNFYSNNSEIMSVTANIIPELNKYPYGILTHIYEAETGELQMQKSDVEGNAVWDYKKKKSNKINNIKDKKIDFLSFVYK